MLYLMCCSDFILFSWHSRSARQDFLFLTWKSWVWGWENGWAMVHREQPLPPTVFVPAVSSWHAPPITLCIQQSHHHSPKSQRWRKTGRLSLLIRSQVRFMHRGLWSFTFCVKTVRMFFGITQIICLCSKSPS